MKILILGASGYAGQAIARQLDKNYEVYGTCHSQKNGSIAQNRMIQLDINASGSIKEILNRIRPQIIISSLRGNFQLQFAVHHDVADYLEENKTGKIIFLSSANAFDAAKEKPHYESDKTASHTDYGSFKIACERLLQEKLNDRCVIVRIPEIWGKDCPRILKLIEDTENRTPIVTYPNLQVNYTTNIQIAEWIACIIEKDLGGIFHIGTGDTCDYMQFQAELSALLGLKKPVFKKESVPQTCFQAVLPGRREIPEKLQMKVTDVLHYLEDVQK